MIKTRKGFTLAEVLTTLMVIGVVAAMTIPTLMNSTNDQQYKVAYKKAMSVLSQGVQLLVAKEEECEIAAGTDTELAKCMQKVISGTLSNEEGDPDANGNVIVTSDGMAYAFFLDTDVTPGAGNHYSIDMICGDEFGTAADDYSGANAKCAVVVDVNGLNKGAKEFTTTSIAGAAATSDSLKGGDQQAILLTGAGTRPYWVDSVDKANEGYKWMYGENANPLS